MIPNTRRALLKFHKAQLKLWQSAKQKYIAGEINTPELYVIESKIVFHETKIKEYE